MKNVFLLFTCISCTVYSQEMNLKWFSDIKTNRDCETTYTVPNIFTPNNDGVNETWGVKFNNIRDVKDFSLFIYNRWGVPILQTNLPNLRWDGYTTSGIACADGVYFYVCVFKIKDEQRTLKGNITLIR
ncbi:MAG: gliding motility-associated C-terminal domain-containing protein [Bacteroidia bacterium]|nr:gliding motility-associated C-terminal domain-containing protein [Bacteroidia bacterium]